MTQTPPRNYLGLAFLTSLAFFPVGAFAIKFALQVNKKYESGDYEGAVLASEQARKFCIMGILVSSIIYIIPLLGIGYFKLFPNTYIGFGSGNKIANLNIECDIISSLKDKNLKKNNNG
jgi:hypothetical protein